MSHTEEKSRLIKTAVSIKDTQLEACKALAEEKDISVSAIVRWALDEYFSLSDYSTCRTIKSSEYEEVARSSDNAIVMRKLKEGATS